MLFYMEPNLDVHISLIPGLLYLNMDIFFWSRQPYSYSYKELVMDIEYDIWTECYVFLCVWYDNSPWCYLSLYDIFIFYNVVSIYNLYNCIIVWFWWRRLCYQLHRLLDKISTLNNNNTTNWICTVLRDHFGHR
jgi:hypothetical protein